MSNDAYRELKSLAEQDEDAAQSIADVRERTNRRNRHLLFFAVLLLLGMGAYVAGDQLDEEKHHLAKKLLTDSALALSAVSLVEFVNLLLLAHETERAVQRAIRKYIPRSLQNVVESGIVNFEAQLDWTQLQRRIRTAGNARMRVLRMRFVEFYQLKNDLREAIENGCTIELLLLSPYCDDIIRKRLLLDAHSNGSESAGVETFRRSMLSVLKELDTFQQSLGAQKNNLKLRIHNSYMSLSLFGVGHNWTVGFFLLGHDVINGPHIRVVGSSNDFQKALDLHFAEIWKRAQDYPFGKSDAEISTFLNAVALK